MAPEDTQGARGYDERGNVRPADGRLVVQTEDEQRAQREAEIQAGYEKLLEQRKEEDRKNQEALDASGYVNPTVAPSEHLAAQQAAAEAVAGQGPAGDDVDDRYTGMDYGQLQAEARDRDGVKGNLPMPELRAALRADDAAKA